MVKKNHVVLNYLIKYQFKVHVIKLSLLSICIVETFSPEDTLNDNLCFQLLKGSSYIKCQGFKNKTIIGFKPLRGLFTQFQYLLAKYMGN